MKRVRLIDNGGLMVGKIFDDYAMMPPHIFLATFLPQDVSYCWVPPAEPADICCYGIGLKDDSILRDNELNVFVSVENFGRWASPDNNEIGWVNPHYYFYHKYKHFGSKKTDIYIHNDKSDAFQTPLYKCIPTVHCRISYFNRAREYYKKIPKTPFEKKKFILFISKNVLNSNKQRLMEHLVQIGLSVDHISQYDHILKHTSCYHSKELLTVFSQYKFIAAFENSHTNGYITEKIFNVFFAGAIPIYDGAPDIARFINPKAFLSLEPMIAKKLQIIANSKAVYEKIVQTDKIQKEYKNVKIEF